MRDHDTRITRLVWAALLVGLQLIASQGFAQSDTSALSEPVTAFVRFILDFLGPAIAICGFIFAGAQFLAGETGRPFKVGLGCIVGGVLIASAEDIWTNFFGGTGLGG